MMNTYRRGGAARVYWLTLPAPRDPDRAVIARAVNAAIRAAAAPYRAQVRVLDMDTLFTPDWRFQDSITVDGRETLVRDADGIHLNRTAPRSRPTPSRSTQTRLHHRRAREPHAHPHDRTRRGRPGGAAP